MISLTRKNICIGHALARRKICRDIRAQQEGEEVALDPRHLEFVDVGLTLLHQLAANVIHCLVGFFDFTISWVRLGDLISAQTLLHLAHRWLLTIRRRAGISPRRIKAIEILVADSKIMLNASLNALLFPDSASNL